MTINEAVEVLRKEYGCRTAKNHDCFSFGSTCDGCEHYVDADTVTEALKTVLDTFGICSVLLTSQTKFKPGSKFLLEIGEKRIGLDEYSIVGTDLYVWGSLLEKLTPYEQKWIQCEKELPKERDWYLGIFKEPGTGWVNPIPFICDYVGRETKITTKDFWILRENLDDNNPYYRDLECVAWTSLPEPYRGDTDE